MISGFRRSVRTSHFSDVAQCRLPTFRGTCRPCFKGSSWDLQLLLQIASTDSHRKTCAEFCLTVVMVTMFVSSCLSNGIAYVCVYVCLFVCMCVCMFVCMYVCMHAYMYVCLYVCCMFVCNYYMR
jgi:hypothetical protein